MFAILKRIFAVFFEVIQTIVLALAIFVVIYLFAAQPHQVKGASMMPNLVDGEYILTEKVSYRFRSPKRGEVVIFKAPDKPELDYIKRVIGLPGEKIRIINGTLYINDVPLREDYLNPSLQISSGRFLKENETYTVPESSFIVFGDNRSHSSDSREFGPVKKEAIIGVALIRYWPLDTLGKIKNPTY